MGVVKMEDTLKLAENEQERIYGFNPIIYNDSVVLILGTLPGQKSIEAHEYYSDPTNRFWDMLFCACDAQPDITNYEAKTKFLRDYKIALWDVLESAIRSSSKDKDIKDARANDLPQRLADYPNIKLLIFNSMDTYKYFRRFFKNTAIPYVCVSSPSGLNTKSREEKVQEWKAALSIVLPQLQSEHKLMWIKPPHS